MSEITFPKINPAQTKLIESVHKGFLFQHLYAVGCLLSALNSDATAVIVEADEDIELERPFHRDYIQVKTRSSSLNYSDIEGAVQRFNLIRTEHALGHRKGSAKFFFVANQPPGLRLMEMLRADEWPKDVCVLWPRCDTCDVPTGLPPAWSDISEAFDWCVEKAERILFRRLSPDTMVWKLAAQAMMAASGGEPYQNHTFMISSLSELFEQIVTALQGFPSMFGCYRPQSNEPDFISEKRLRIITGFSGAGKTTWASESALHSAKVCVYFDVGENPGPALASMAVREVVAKLAALSADTPISDILLPYASGTESFRLADRYIEKKGLHLVVIIDNAHRVSADILRTIVDATSHISFILLCQPSGSIQELEAMLGLDRESLEGWDDDTIAAVVEELGAIGSPNAIYRLRSMTAGMPLYIESAGRIAVSDYGGDLEKFCDAIDQQNHTTETAQEIILSKVYNSLPEAMQQAVALLGFCEVGLSQIELNSLLIDGLNFRDRDVSLLVRTLRPLGVLQILSGNQFKLHDALRILAMRHFELIEQNRKTLILRALIAILHRSVSENRDVKRLSLLIRASVALGDYNILVGLAGEEMFHELGVDSDIWQLLEKLVSLDVMNSKQQFGALDGLIFRSFKTGDTRKVPERLSMMGNLLETGQLDDHDKMAYMSKRMQWQSMEGDFKAVMDSLSEISKIVPGSPEYQRVFKYGAAQALWKLERIGDAEIILRNLVQDYYKALGISSDQVFGRNITEITNSICKTSNYHADIKHLADTLEFHAMTIVGSIQTRASTRIQAMKFYQIVGATDSLVRVGMDLVDDFLSAGDTFGAKEIMEKYVMPDVEHLNIALQRIFVHSQYAVVLARCGQCHEAEKIITRLRPYYKGSSAEELRGLMINEKLVREAILQKPIPRAFSSTASAGRNDLCPCGSGIKFKKCHGKHSA